MTARAPDPATVPGPALARWTWILALLTVGVRLLGGVGTVAVVAAIVVATASDRTDVGGILTSLATVTVLGQLLNALVTLPLLVLALVVAVRCRGRGRTGGIVLVASIVLGLASFWVLTVSLPLLLGPEAGGSPLHLVLEGMRSVVVLAGILVGAVLVRGAARAAR